MEGLKFLNKIAVFTISIFLFISCNPSEPKLDLQLEKQQVGVPFSFADYCNKEYDSVFLIYPYFNTEREEFTNIKMSKALRKNVTKEQCSIHYQQSFS